MTATGVRRVGVALLGASLTSKELESLRWVAQGFSAEEVMRATGSRSAYTVKSQLKSAYAKLGADNAAHAVHLAVAAGWLDPVSGLPNKPPVPPRAS